MCSNPLWLLAALAFIASVADGGPMNIVSAPNLLRIGTEESIFVECQGCTGGPINVGVKVLTHPTREKDLATTNVQLNSGNNYQALAKLTIPSTDFSKDRNMKQYVYLQAVFPSGTLEKTVLVSFQSGFIFIQTDKTLYTPKSTVNFRLFAVTPGMVPIVKDGKADSSVIIDIVTPEKVTIQLEPVSLESGMQSGSFDLADIVSPGLWQVVAKFSTNPQQTFSADFEVKEYVLPSFEIKLKSLSPFFYVDSKELKVAIEATYLFGKDVDGTAHVVFGVMFGKEKKTIPASLQRVPVRRGKGEITLTREQILETFPDISALVGNAIFVSASVLTESGSEMVEAEIRGIQIVTSPYTVIFTKTPKFYKPGLPFPVLVQVLNPDKTPAKGVRVEVNPGSVPGITSEDGMATLSINTDPSSSQIVVQARTTVPAQVERQANASMTIKPYYSQTKSYISLALQRVGDNLKMDINILKPSAGAVDITYLILSRGQLVKHGHHPTKGQAVISKMEPISKNMLPSFRVIVYYHTEQNEVVSDSVWMEVKTSCMGSLKLEPSRTAPSYEPRGMFRLKLTGDPGAKVGLVAVDKGVYVLNNEHILTQKKVWEEVEKYDTGCTPGGGKDNMGVFTDAGLMFRSNTVEGPPHRQELKCTQPSRKKRTTLADVITSLVSHYKTELERECCLDGLKETRLSYTCQRRSEYINDGKPCSDAFLNCCKKMEGQRASMKHEQLKLARSEEEDNSYMDTNEVVSRTDFPESWLWTTVDIPECPKELPDCLTQELEKDIPLKESITTWRFTGISLSKTHGICVGEPLDVIVQKEFFIDLKLPYSAVRSEQVEVKAILHNYTPEILTVRVDLMEMPHMCSAAHKRGRFRQEVQIGPKTTRSVPFVIIPMEHRDVEIDVRAVVKDRSLYDGVKKTLRVVSEGVLVPKLQVISLNPTKQGGKQEQTVNSAIPEEDIIPNTPTQTLISVSGREELGGLVENAISGSSMGSLIRQPFGCGEQTMIFMTLPVIATTYLDKTKQWAAVGFSRRDEALRHINTGYVRELTFRKNDGSFGAWLHHPSSIWLTAYVAKVFSMAHGLVGIKKNIICDAIRFIIVKGQQPEGEFIEVAPVIHGEMTGDVRGSDSDASMTAFCLIAMQESRQLCTSQDVNSLPEAITKAVSYLEKQLAHLTNPYAIAMTSYALANEKKLNRDILMKAVSPELDHWRSPKGHVYTLEATAYALLALVKNKNLEDARPIVRWLNKQQKVGGGYGSTQATIMVYQAVAEYWTMAKEPDYNLKVSLQLPGRSDFEPDLQFNRDNHYSTRTNKVDVINKNMTVVAEGSGEATLRMVSLYYGEPVVKENNCRNFSLDVQLLPDPKDEKSYLLRIEYLYKNPDKAATMTVLDVGLLTGTSANKEDLDLLVKGHANVITKYELDSALSNRGSVIIYMDKVSNKRPEEIVFRLKKDMEVRLIQPATVSIYEYYEETHCVKYYHPQREKGELLTLCQEDSACACAEENCSMQKKDKVDNNQRKIKACETTKAIKIDFIYKLQILSKTIRMPTDIYKVMVLDTVKEGSVDVGARGKERFFLSYSYCESSLNLVEGKTYLVMGSSQNVKKDIKNNSYRYLFGENTWIEYWPTRTECQTEQFQQTCFDLNEFTQRFRRFGCNQ